MQPAKAIRVPIGLAEIFPPEAILLGLQHRTKPEVVAELVARLTALGHLKQEEEKAIIESVLAREKFGSTAPGNSIAFPHCRTSITERFLGVLAIDPRGLSFDAVDGEPVQSVFLVLAPLEAREHFFEILGRISAIGRNKSLQYQLRGCSTAAEAHRLLKELDGQ